MEQDWPKGEEGGAEGPEVRAPGLEGFAVRASQLAGGAGNQPKG